MVGIVGIQTVLERRLRSSDQQNFYVMTRIFEIASGKEETLEFGSCKPCFWFLGPFSYFALSRRPADVI